MLLAAHNRATYQLVFDAIFPRHTATLTAALAVWWDVPAVTTSVLKCLDELCYNRGLRIAFGASSAAGILLFREASAAIVAYGSRVATLRPTPHEAYAAKYKGVSAALSIFSHCLDGGYVNFGVFSLYGDPALSSAFETVLKLMLAVPVDEVMVRAGVEKPLGAAAGARARALAAITPRSGPDRRSGARLPPAPSPAPQAHPKFSLTWLAFLSNAFRSHMDILVELDTPSLLQIVQTLTTSLDSLEPEVSSQASYALDFFATYYVRNVKKDTPAMAALRRHLTVQPQLFEALMKLVFHVVVFGEIGRSWSLPKPLLSLILAAELVRPNVRAPPRAAPPPERARELRTIHRLRAHPLLPSAAGLRGVQERDHRHAARRRAAAHAGRVPAPDEGHHAITGPGEPRPLLQPHHDLPRGGARVWQGALIEKGDVKQPTHTRALAPAPSSLPRRCPPPLRRHAEITLHVISQLVSRLCCRLWCQVGVGVQRLERRHLALQILLHAGQPVRALRCRVGRRGCALRHCLPVRGAGRRKFSPVARIHAVLARQPRSVRWRQVGGTARGRRRRRRLALILAALAAHLTEAGVGSRRHAPPASGAGETGRGEWRARGARGRVGVVWQQKARARARAPASPTHRLCALACCA